MAERLDLNGIIPAVVTPMNRAAEVDYRQLRDYARWLLGYAGLKGVAVNMDTGEGPHLADAEKIEIIKAWKKEARGGLPILAGISARSTREAAALAADCRAAGADALVVFPHPVFTGGLLGPEIPLAYHQAIAKASGLPLVLFQLQEALGGAIFSEETLLALCGMKSAAALKEASFDAVTFVRTAAAMKKAKVKTTLLTGNDNFIYESFLLGATGALIGFGTLAVAEQIEMHRAAARGDYETGQALWDRVKILADTVFARPVRDYRARTKAALAEQGVIKCAAMRPPLMEIGGAEREKVRAALRKVNPAAPR